MKSILLKNGVRRFFKPTEIMGIINVNEDSFYAGSRAASLDAALQMAEEMIRDGATVLDIGGESTRPGSKPVTAEEEAERVCPAIRGIRERWPDILISVDTYHASTAKKAIDAGADIVNDITGLLGDPDMIPVCAKAQVPVIIMHSKGDPEHMQDDPQYDDVVEEVYAYLKDGIERAVAGGILKERIMIDVGIGFGKTLEHNMALLQNIRRFNELNVPHLMAVSRKTWIGALLGSVAAPVPSEDRLFGTVASTIYAYTQNIEMVRVHDVKENAEALYIFKKLMERSPERIRKEGETVQTVIALGSNIGDRKAYLDEAIHMMDEKAGHIVKQSQVQETKAYGYTDQEDFLNMAVLLETPLAPYELLDVLHEIEDDLARRRVVRWGPRTIDLDIIFYGDLILNDQDLTIPHPDYRNRDFVMTPLLEIVPDFTDPVTGKKVSE